MCLRSPKHRLPLPRVPNLLLLLAICALAFSACGGSESDGDGATKTPVTTLDCTATGESPRTALPCPSSEVVAGIVTVKTNLGSFEIELATDSAPLTTSSFRSLVEAGFFDGLSFHRVVPEYVVQGGDPAGVAGGPGYQVVEPPPADTRYVKGIVAMAKTELDPPGASGSQFFVVTGAEAALPPDYAILGTVVAGMGAVKAIEATGTAGVDGPPNRPVTIKSMTFKPTN